MSVTLSGLALTRDQLEEIRATLRERIRVGLQRSDTEIACLPAYLPFPPAKIRGQALVVDTGGTNMRAAMVELAAEESKIIAGPIEKEVPSGRGDQPVTGEEFFQAQAELVEELNPPRGLPLGYCFSYPAEVLPERDARLLRWTKSIRISGVEGTLVGSRLRNAMAVLEPGEVRVLNDTVAALMGGAALKGHKYPAFIGLIVGTGTNMAAFFPDVPKLGSFRGPMAVNLESGNFNPPHLTEWDEKVDAESDNPGRQRFEKAVSGFYLPKVMNHVMPGSVDPDGSSASVSSMIKNSEAARLVLMRSADLVAAALAACIDHLEGQPVGIQAEGSLIWRAHGYADRVRETLSKLTTVEFELLRAQEVNLIGAACAALVP